jgi:hypothetical protein
VRFVRQADWFDLKAGAVDANRWVYAGHVGTGFDQAALKSLYGTMQQRQRRRKGPSHSTDRQQRQSARSKTRRFGAICTTPGNLCLRETAWWGWEDSNLQPSDYQPLAPAGPISGKLSNFSTRITHETRAALEAAASESGQSSSQVAERMIRLGLNTVAERERSNPTQALAFLIGRLAEGCAVDLGDQSFHWNTDSFLFDVLAYGTRLMLERLRPPDSALSREFREGKDVDELDRKRLANFEEWAEHVFVTFWKEVTG